MIKQNTIIELYERDWSKFRTLIELKSKNRCFISAKNWIRLQEYHLESFLKTKIKNPFGFLLKMKIMHPEKYDSIKGMPRMLHTYGEIRHRQFCESKQ